MPLDKGKLQKIYSTLKQGGYAQSYDEFEKGFCGNDNYPNRKKVYDLLTEHGADIGSSYEDFMKKMQKSSSPKSSAQSPKMTAQQKAQAIAWADDMMQRTEHSMANTKERMGNMLEYSKRSKLGFGQTVEGKTRFNQRTGKLEKTYLTPTGNRYGESEKALADFESQQYRTGTDMSVGGQLRRAHQKLAELKEKREKSAQRVLDETTEFNEKNLTSLGRALIGGQMYSSMQMGDKENNALEVAIRQTEELIKDLEEQQDREAGKDVGFWRGFGRTVGDFRTWDFGMGDLKDAMTMMNADQLKGKNATQGEREAHDEMMGAIAKKQEAEQMYGGNASFWNRAGVMTGYMPSFMVDFVLTGGGYEVVNAGAKAGAKAGVKMLGKNAVKEMAEQGFKSYVKKNGVKGFGQYATNWTVKALGTTADDLLVRAPLMTNTVQLGKTTADIIDRKLGDVVVDENGNYDFSNDKTWGSAIWQGEANAIVENYSEMFGAHLDPVLSLKNMGKLANVVGAKRLGSVLAKADAGALSGVMGRTHELFNKMGVSDYAGEVSEEYYGQLWRTMLNLDDAYQENPDGTRTNPFKTGQFHGDIWGGMALSMGLMGAGKHTLNAATYASMKHGVNKADARASEMLGADIWEPLRATLDLATNDNIGDVADAIVNDKDFTNEEKAAVLTYMERSLNMRGFNLATLAQKRGGEQDKDQQTLDESYLDGYNMENPQEMTDAKNMLEYQRQRVAERLGEDILADIDNDPEGAIGKLGVDAATNSMVLDYLNARQVYNGMIQRVRDDMDGRISQSEAMIGCRVHRTTGMIQPATMKQDDRKVYVVRGELVQYEDGNGIDLKASDESIIVRDAETGKLEQVAPDAILNIDEPLNVVDELAAAREAIRQQFAQEAANKIDGKLAFNPGDVVTINDGSGQKQITIIGNATDENEMPIEGQVVVQFADGTQNSFAKDALQQFADAANIERVQEFEQHRATENAEADAEQQETARPQYAMNDLVTLKGDNDKAVRGNITANEDADGKFEVYTEDPINGRRVNLFTRDELDNLLIEHNGTVVEQPSSIEVEEDNAVEEVPKNSNIEAENIPESTEEADNKQETEETQPTAFERIPKDEQGNPIYEQTDADTAWDAIVEQTEGDEAMAQTVANGMVADKQAALSKAEKAKSKGGTTIAEKIAAERERSSAINNAKAELEHWQKIAATANRRKMEAESERRKAAEQLAAQRRAEEERLRAEKEEAERIEREALNGVPDMVDDTPQDARARGYRRQNGHKIDRQEPVQGVQGKDVDVKFSDKDTVKGRVAVIEAEQLQPSHVQGSRNARHFIDEAQSKERNDSASVLSAQKIATNIRPEEITSSVTAYTGAPTVNVRGEVIQGNNRSDALRLMWQAQKEQAAKYKQYLKDHAEEFGVNAGDIENMQHPVLVNMLDVDDDRAIELGQYVAQDTESGGTERIKPKNAVQKMGADMRTFANLLLQSSDEETSFAGLVDKNGVETLKWMSAKGHITPTQYQSAFDSKGYLTAEAKNDLKSIMYQSIFQGGSTQLEEMFNAMPVKAQKAILATAYRDYDSPNAERMVVEIQNSIRAFNALSGDEAFVTAKNYKEARMAVEAWKRQYQFDDATGESYLPAERFSNFALHLATMYRGETQSFIQTTFNKLYDLIQGTQEENLFEHPDNTPRTLVQAIKETFNFDYNGQQRSNVLVGDSAASQRGQQGSTGNAATGKRVEDGERTADSGGSVRVSNNEQGGQRNLSDTARRQPNNLPQGEIDENGHPFVVSSDGTTSFGEIREESGLPAAPIKLSEGYQDEDGKGYGLVHIEANHGEQIRKAGFASVEEFVSFVAKNYDEDNIRVGKRRDHIGTTTYLIQVTDEHDNTLFIELSRDGSYWNVNSGGIFRKGYSNKKETVVKTEPQQPNNAVSTGSSLSENDESGISIAEPNGEPTVSADKDTTKSPITNDLGEKIAKEEEKVDVNPTEKQKEAGNYKKGHVQVGTFNVTIENPKGSVRSGVDANGNKWETTMQNTYGYIRGTEGVDGDHIDVFLSEDIDGWNGRKVFVIDQRNADGSFDEHKVMLGFNDIDEAEAAYMSNYEKGWHGLGTITGVAIEDFEKWIASSHRKTKPFAEYKSVKTTEGQNASADENLKHNLADFKEGDVVSDYYDKKLYRIKKHSSNGITTLADLDAEGNEVNTTTLNTHNNPRFSIAEAPVKEEVSTTSQEKEQAAKQDGNALYSIEPAQYTTKRGKVLDMHLVKFDHTLTKEQQRAAKELAKAEKGWYDAKQGGFMMRSEESARKLADTILDNEEAVSDAQPVSMTDVKAVNDGEVVFSEPQQPKKQDEKSQPVWQYSVSVDKETGHTTLTRDDVSGVVPVGDARFHHTAESPEEMLAILRNPLNGMQDVLEAVGVTLENKIKTRELDRKANEEKAQPQQAEKPKDSGQFGLVSDQRMEELKARLRKKMFGGQLNCGIDPEILTIGIELTAGHIDRGIKKFADFAKVMIEDLGDAIRPYLKAFYNGAREMPEIMESGLAEEMTPYDEVRTFDVANFDKTSIDAMATAETVTRETEVGQEVEVAHKRIKEKRNNRKMSEKKSVTLQQSSESSLFDGIDNKKEKEDGRTIQELPPSDGTQRKGDSKNGVGRADRRSVLPPQSRDTGSTTDVEQGRVDGDIQGRGNDGRRNSSVQGGRSQSEAQRGGSGLSDDAVAEKKNTRNNHSERGEDHAPTSVNARIEANIKAIELAQQLIESGETATPEQMAVLRKFSGWGGLGAAFNTSSYDWKIRERNQKIMQLLGKDAYQQAVMSANSAYYTPAYVVDTLWDIAERMGFKGGNILEGSAGIGNILGQMPIRISERSDIHAVEIDSTSGGILSLLYPDAHVEIQGFEQTRIPNGSVDLAITNVPFVTGLRVNDTTGDKDLSRKFYNIHDFCIAKNVRKLREGGLGIFITSNGTLDNSKKLRDWIVGEGGADFVGAFRMNNKTFGGTGVTSDIIVIRKRVNGKKSANAIDVSIVTGERMAEFDTGDTRKVKGKTMPVIKHLSMDYNQYFIEHPENMAGEMRFAFENGETFRPTSKGLYPTANKKQTEMLASWVSSLAEKKEESAESTVEDEATHINEQLGKGVKEGSMVLNSQRDLCMARMGEAVPIMSPQADKGKPQRTDAERLALFQDKKVKGHTKAECFKAYSAIKDALAEVLAYQAENEDDKGLKPLIAKLNTAYDNFVDAYGHFNKNTAIAFLRNDVDYANVASVETYKEVGDGKGGVKRTFGKAGVMTARVVEKDKEPTPTNIKDGIIASMFKFGRVDASYIAEQLGKEKTAVEAEIIESGLGFRDPASQQIEVSYQYQSGNVREKLRQAQENNENGEYDRNIKALQEVMPMDIPAHLIDFTLGSSWIEPKLYEEYVKERTDVDVHFTAVGGSWFMDSPREWLTNKEKNRSMGVVSEVLGKTIMGHTLIEAAIQNRSVTVSTTKKTWDGKTETITDKEATQACVAKIVEIRQDFKEWARQKMQGDTEMSERMERVYNDAFNNYVPMNIPEEFVPEFFDGASHKFHMRPHQGKAIVRGTMQPLLLAHEVGSGKTFTLISTAMEMRRLGTARKPMIVVQNATVGQFVASAKELYPNAKILTLDEADRSAEGRKNFYAKIRYNDWDMIVVPQSTFEFIPDSEERQMVYVQDKIEEKMLVLEKMKEADPDGKSMITRQAEREIAALEEELAGLSDEASKKRTANDEKKRAVAMQNAEVKAMEMLDRKTDNVENFDDMGIDALLIDEAHEYKHLGFATAMQRGVKGVDPSYSKKSQGVYLKTQAVLEKNNGRNVVFATGTPISNTAAEIWTFMRYLMPADNMKECGIYYFDDFVRNFGNVQPMLEFTTNGKFKENNRFAGYVNLPELVRIWSGVADTVRFKEIEEDLRKQGKPDLRPDIEGGKAQDIYLPQTRALRAVMKYVKSELEAYDKMSGKEKKERKQPYSTCHVWYRKSGGG